MTVMFNSKCCADDMSTDLQRQKYFDIINVVKKTLGQRVPICTLSDAAVCCIYVTCKCGPGNIFCIPSGVRYNLHPARSTCRHKDGCKALIVDQEHPWMLCLRPSRTVRRAGSSESIRRVR